MEHEAAISDGEWNSFNGIYSSPTNKEADFMAQLLENCSNVPWSTPSSNLVNMVGLDETSMYSSNSSSDDNNATNLYYFSQSQASNCEGYGYYTNEESNQVFVTNINNNSNPSMDYFMVNGDAKSTKYNLMEGGDDFLNQDVSNDSLENSNENNILEHGVHETSLLLDINVPDSSSDVAKKRSRGLVDGMQKNQRNVKGKKNNRVSSSSNDEEEKNAVFLHRQNSMRSCSEDDDSNAFQEFNGRTTRSSTSKGAGNSKTRATRGSATDPQSLYARKRRERINERLRILQNLVPNGTKVDISTMLEEAVQYVKFLQLQIKLLSSDDLWMYAPIAYNGMDIGLDLKIATTPKSS